MRLYEFQAKRIFAEHGVPTPAGTLVTSPSQVAGLPLPCMLKAQVPVGGRGKAGGVRAVHTAEQATQALADLLQMRIRGHRVRAVLAEEVAEVRREMYLAVLLDSRANAPLVMACAAGGVEIEEFARANPEQVLKLVVDPLLGLQGYQLRHLAKFLKLQDVAGLGEVVRRLYGILLGLDASLVEVNPLAETPAGLVALDGKMVLDDRARFRHEKLFAALAEEQAPLHADDRSEAERLAREYGLTYVELDGDVAMIADGAGTGMLTLDLIRDEGGRPANFCEMGGQANAEYARRAMEVVLANPRARALLITLIGGLTRMDEIAAGIAAYVEAHGLAVPVAIRMCGTQEAAGKATLKAIGLDTYDDMTAAVRAAVAMAKV